MYDEKHSSKCLPPSSTVSDNLKIVYTLLIRSIKCCTSNTVPSKEDKSLQNKLETKEEPQLQFTTLYHDDLQGVRIHTEKAYQPWIGCICTDSPQLVCHGNDKTKFVNEMIERIEKKLSESAPITDSRNHFADKSSR